MIEQKPNLQGGIESHEYRIALLLLSSLRLVKVENPILESGRIRSTARPAN